MIRYKISASGAHENDDGVWVMYEAAMAEITKLRAELEQERELADRMYGALGYIDDYCLAYPELESISAVSSSAIEYVDTRRNK